MKAKFMTVLGVGVTLALTQLGTAVARPGQEEWRQRAREEGNAPPAEQQRPAPQPQPSQPPDASPRRDGGPGNREPRPAPAAPPQPPAPPLPAPSAQPPRLGAPGNAAPNVSDPGRGHWNTGGARPGEAPRDAWRRGNDARNSGRGFDRDDRRAWNGERGAPPARRDYQWRDYDRYRAQNFRFDGSRYYGRSRFRAGDFYWPRGYARNVWIVGAWLPSVFFLDARYQLIEYWRFGLYDPPVGCHWIRVGYDAVLVDDFNGEILDEVYDLFW